MARGLTVKGVNSLLTDQLFAERFAAIAGSEGRFGCIIPSAIATGAGAQYLFQDFTRRGAVESLRGVPYPRWWRWTARPH